MAQGYVVLAPNTPPDSSKVVAAFLAGSTQGLNTALAQANAFRGAEVPTGTVQLAEFTSYNTGVVINP